MALDELFDSTEPDARTRLTETSRQLQVAAEQQSDAPTTVLASLAQVEDLLEQAERLARTDVALSGRGPHPDDTGGDLGGLLDGSSG